MDGGIQIATTGGTTTGATKTPAETTAGNASGMPAGLTNGTVTALGTTKPLYRAKATTSGCKTAGATG